MNLFREANRFCARLWKDESGVVLALTVVIFLTLFVMACSVYAIGETIRQRIELQNAADAAAYSAAVVQADGISRIAAINKAMGWTYVKMGRMTMDYIADKWLKKVYDDWSWDRNFVRGMASSSSCSSGGYTGPNDWYAGRSYTPYRQHVLLNKHDWVAGDEINNERLRAAQAGKSYQQLAEKITIAKQTVRDMNSAEEEIIENLQNRMEKTCQGILRANISPCVGEEIKFSFIHDAGRCFEIVHDEGGFLRMVFGRGTKATHEKIFGPKGTDVWFKKSPSDIERHYEQQGSSLIAEWWWRWGIWHWVRHGRRRNYWWSCDLVASDSGYRAVRAEEVRDEYFVTETAKPQKLTTDFFEKSGAIIVGVSRRMFNPFVSTFGATGIFSSFNPPSKSSKPRYMWAVAAARAGYREEGDGRGAEGSYNPTPDSWYLEKEDGKPAGELSAWWRDNNGWQGLSPKNLSETDWDAVLLPLHRAWSSREPAWQPRNQGVGTGNYVVGKWRDETAHKILDHLWNSTEWKELYGSGSVQGLSQIATGDAPPGMIDPISFGSSIEDLVYH